jgi:hypothetical protein
MKITLRYKKEKMNFIQKFSGRIFFLSPLLFFSILSNAQGARNPTPQEMAVINKAVNAIDPVINGFVNSNWKKLSGGAMDGGDYSVQVKPDVALGVAPFNDWEFDVRENSDLWSSMIKPLQDKLLQMPDVNDQKAMTEYAGIGDKIKNLQNIYVEVHVNEKSLPVKPAKGSAPDLKLPGAWMAYKQTPDHFIGTDRNLKSSYVILFGNWGNARSNGSGDYEFQYKHPDGTPYIENIVVIITGNEDAIKQILQKTSWKDINDALTL